MNADLLARHSPKSRPGAGLRLPKIQVGPMPCTCFASSFLQVPRKHPKIKLHARARRTDQPFWYLSRAVPQAGVHFISSKQYTRLCSAARYSAVLFGLWCCIAFCCQAMLHSFLKCCLAFGAA
eukprot:1149744-Pelagomonas_calceolata.AAC.9